MPRSDINILWIELCKNRKNAQRIGSINKKITTYKIHSIDKNQISRAIAINKPNLICIDYDFLDLPGLQLLRHIRSGHSDIPVVMLTIQHSENLAVWAFRTGVRNYLVKPVSVESIIEEINRLITQLKPGVTKPRINLLKRYPIPKEFHFISTSLLSQRTISAINYVETHFQEKITEREVAAICGMSVFTFSRIFRNEHSITFREFLIKHRIMRAKEFLRNPKIAIMDVAQLSGFTDTSNFARLFRRYIGITPSHYQKKYTE
ncbi:MAG: response regulator transcription factor [Nitrosomonas sp.]|nr:response regulator transcription factor [Nitrosomonas sp.]MBP6074939.1 response regulator transcription factor [Nitrosomonas sp.]